jgi:hypothetical protein
MLQQDVLRHVLTLTDTDTLRIVRLSCRLVNNLVASVIKARLIRLALRWKRKLMQSEGTVFNPADVGIVGWPFGKDMYRPYSFNVDKLTKPRGAHVPRFWNGGVILKQHYLTFAPPFKVEWRVHCWGEHSESGIQPLET